MVIHIGTILLKGILICSRHIKFIFWGSILKLNKFYIIFKKFFDTIDIIPSTIKTSFFINAELKKLTYFIISPSNKEIFFEENKSHVYNEFIAKEKGDYKFVFSNNKVNFILTLT